jgi:hypothetical protein
LCLFRLFPQGFQAIGVAGDALGPGFCLLVCHGVILSLDRPAMGI